MNSANKVVQQMLGVQFLLLEICAFFGLEGINRAWVRTPSVPMFFVGLSIVEGGSSTLAMETIGQTIPFYAVLPIYCTLDAGTVGTCTGSFSLGCQTNNTTAEER